MEPKVIMTVGHGTGSFAHLERLLEQHHVRTLIDVRSEPYSRRAPDFTKRKLETLAAVAGIGYRWMGDHLGGRPTVPALLKEDGTPDWEQVVAAPGFRGALDEMTVLAAGGRIALLCSEALPDRCHRALVLAPVLEQRGWAVHHIYPDGSAEAHQPSLFPADPA